MPLRIAIVDNLSAYPFRIEPPRFPAHITYACPAGTGEAMQAGECDAALVPVAVLPRLSQVTALPFGIACKGTVGSVLLFSREPVQSLLRARRPVYVTPESQTSRRLLCLLCRMTYNASPLFTASPNVGARLLIGNEASDTQREEHFWPGVYDLGQWWYQATGFPFVFAQWVLKSNLPLERQAAVRAWLEDCAKRSESAAGVRELAAMAAEQELFHGSTAYARRYYLRLRPKLGTEDFDGLGHFLALQEREAPCARIA